MNLIRMFLMGAAATRGKILTVRGVWRGVCGLSLKTVYLTWVAAVAFCFLAVVQLAWSPIWIGGSWADEAFSDVLSQRLGVEIAVEKVHFSRWSHISFEKAAIRNEAGEILMTASSGAIELKKINLSKSGAIDTQIHFEGAELMRRYYGRLHPAKFWTRFLRRPLAIGALSAMIRQNKEETIVQILECRSPDIQLEGEITFKSSGDVENRIHSSMTPRQFLSAL